jgi:hypothetical protein
MNTFTPKLFAALLSVALLSLFSAAGALAEPTLDVQMTRTAQPTHLGDERLAYELTVSNEATAEPEVGTTLTCKGTPDDGGGWSGTPKPDFTYAWLRDGTPIGGETAKTYTATALDTGHSIQCVITGTHDPDGTGTVYDPIAASAVSLPPTVVSPPPSSAPPSGTSQPGVSGPARIATPSGTATASEGSKMLTDVVTASGMGTFTSGSPVVEGVAMSAGRFESVRAASGPCVAPETTISKVEEPAPGIFKVTLSKPATCSGSQALTAGSGPFGSGQEISGECIPAGATVLRTSANGLPPTPSVIEIDQPATCSKAGAAIEGTSILTCNVPVGWTAGTPITWGFQWLRNGEPILGATSASYIVQKADTDPGSILRCMAIAEDEEGGRAVALSGLRPTQPDIPFPYSPVGTLTIPTVDFANQTEGEVTLQLVAPEGEGISVFKALGVGWSCTKTVFGVQPAKATCTRSDPLAPQDSYQPAQVVVALGKNPPATLVTKAEASGGNAPLPATAEDTYAILQGPVPFGFKAFEVEVLDDLGDDYTRAGGHPFSAGATIAFNTHERAEDLGVFTEAVNGSPKEIRTETPAGFVGNPQAVPQLCGKGEKLVSGCPPESVVGGIFASTTGPEPGTVPIFALKPESGQPAQFAFELGDLVFTLNPELRPEDGYAIDLVTQPLPMAPEVFFTEVTLCGYGAITNGPEFEACRKADEAGANPVPFITNPTRCGGEPPVTRIFASNWENPGEVASAEFQSPPLTNCDEVPFDPAISFKTTSSQADSPTGMDVELTLPTAGLEDPNGIAQAQLEGTTVTLPEGMAVNPASASGRGACTLEQLGMSASGVPNDEPVGCPESSKLGTVEADTPILEGTLNGTVYLAKQGSNPFGSLLAIYLVIDSPEKGILVKLAGRVSPDPSSGRLTVTFDNNPQAPLSSVRLHFPGGPRAALVNPPSCGTYAIETQLTPWTAADPSNPTAEETVELSSAFQVTQGPNGSACPAGALEPKLRVGATNPTAGATTPLVLDLSREDGTQRFRSLATTMPPGLTAYLKGVPYCPEEALASIPSAPGTGAAQLASPACPAASQVGTVIAGAGAGPSPLFIDTGRAYLAGPYKGAPLSLAIATPAVTGPFDLGNVVVRAALSLNPQTAQVTATSDPVPTILEGIPLDIRDIRVNVDRPNFTLAPTNCDPLSATATVTGEKGATATVSDRFQVGGCEKLGFKPSLKLKLKGKTRRGAYQKLAATLKARPGDANIKRASVALPHSIFLAQEHIGTVCTRVQFAAAACPKGSVYGKATAVSPLVDYPLEGTVYLRSSSNPLPDMVIAFQGPAWQPVKIELAGRIDSKNGGIRNTFDLAPDAPVTKFTLELRGGNKSLLVSSRNLCKGTQRATVAMDAQNGRERDFKPAVQAKCPKKSKPKGR